MNDGAWRGSEFTENETTAEQGERIIYDFLTGSVRAIYNMGQGASKEFYLGCMTSHTVTQPMKIIFGGRKEEEEGLLFH